MQCTFLQTPHSSDRPEWDFLYHSSEQAGLPPGSCSTAHPHKLPAPPEQGWRPSWTRAPAQNSSAASFNVNVVSFVTFALTPSEPDQTGNQTNGFARKARGVGTRGRSDPALGLGLTSSPRLFPEEPIHLLQVQPCLQQAGPNADFLSLIHQGWAGGEVLHEKAPVCAGKGAAPPNPKTRHRGPDGDPVSAFRRGTLGATCRSALVTEWPSVLWSASGDKDTWKEAISLLSFHIRKLRLETAQMSLSRSLIRLDQD